MKTEQEHNNEQCTMNNVQWKKVKLGEVCAVNPKTDTTKVLDDDFVTFVRMEDVSNDGIIASFSERPYKSLLKKGFTIFQNDDVIFAKITPCMENGKGALVRNMKSKICMGSTEFHVLRACDNVSIDFIYQLTISKQFRQRAEMQMTGSAGQQRVPTAFLEDYLISIPFKNGKPDLSAQRRIAAILASADKVIAATQKTIAKYKQIKQGMMEDLLKPKDGWKMVKLGEGIVKSICTGKLDANAMVEGGAYRFYTCAKDYTFIDNYAFDDEALLISGNGEYVGYVHYYKGKFNAYQRTYVLRGFSIDVNYLQCYLNMYLRDRIKKEMNAGSIPFIKMGTLTEMIICYPASLQEQKRMASILNGIDSKIEVEQRVLNKYIQVKKGLMEKLLNE